MRQLIRQDLGIPATPEVVSPARLRRLANVTLGHLGAVGVDVEIEARHDGRVGIVLPLQWASLLLANLTAQAEAFKEKMQRAALEMSRRTAELAAASVEARQRWEADHVKLYAAYQQFTKKGLSHREALHRLKKDGGETWTVTLLEDVVRRGRSLQRRREKDDYDDSLRSKLAGEMTIREIAQVEGISIERVRSAVARARRRAEAGQEGLSVMMSNETKRRLHATTL